ncbi:fibroblast growth factor receptor 1-like [Amphiura filiformis]|uniref:fibroblast growth factor receptor 1-like n=1 Tax=Amphiura filiformis TaxID=82378 RepID=UPI003B21AC0C
MMARLAWIVLVMAVLPCSQSQTVVDIHSFSFAETNITFVTQQPTTFNIILELQTDQSVTRSLEFLFYFRDSNGTKLVELFETKQETFPSGSPITVFKVTEDDALTVTLPATTTCSSDVQYSFCVNITVLETGGTKLRCLDQPSFNVVCGRPSLVVDIHSFSFAEANITFVTQQPTTFNIILALQTDQSVTRSLEFLFYFRDSNGTKLVELFETKQETFPSGSPITVFRVTEDDALTVTLPATTTCSSDVQYSFCVNVTVLETGGTKLRCLDQPSFNVVCGRPSLATNPTYWIIPVVAAMIFGVIVACVFYCWRRRNAVGKKENNTNNAVHSNPTFEPNADHEVNLKPSHNRHNISTRTQPQDTGYLTPLPPQRPVKACEITGDHLRFMKELGSGQYGVVWLAETKMITKSGVVTKVVVKTTKEGATTSEKEDLRRELNLMKKFKNHPNVLEYLAGCVVRGSLCIILEYMARGTLRQVLMNSRQLYDYAYTRKRDIQSTLSQTQLMIFAQQVATGMNFITSNKCVHRDLAARNVLVSEDLVCKVSDFGLAREEEEYHRKSDIKLPLRWMSIESWADGIHTKESDVWSFGILLWEIVTLGARPYPGMGTRVVIREVESGYRMPKPTHCLQEVYDIMCGCWSSNPSNRPSFAEVIQKLDRIIDMQSDYLLLDEIDEHLYDDTGVIDEDEKV